MILTISGIRLKYFAKFGKSQNFFWCCLVVCVSIVVSYNHGEEAQNVPFIINGIFFVSCQISEPQWTWNKPIILYPFDESNLSFSLIYWLWAFGLLVLKTGWSQKLSCRGNLDRVSISPGIKIRKNTRHFQKWFATGFGVVCLRPKTSPWIRIFGLSTIDVNESDQPRQNQSQNTSELHRKLTYPKAGYFLKRNKWPH